MVPFWMYRRTVASYISFFFLVFSFANLFSFVCRCSFNIFRLATIFWCVRINITTTFMLDDFIFAVDYFFILFFFFAVFLFFIFYSRFSRMPTEQNNKNKKKGKNTVHGIPLCIWWNVWWIIFHRKSRLFCLCVFTSFFLVRVWMWLEFQLHSITSILSIVRVFYFLSIFIHIHALNWFGWIRLKNSICSNNSWSIYGSRKWSDININDRSK